MKKTEIYRFYAFGYNYCVLQNHTHGCKIHGDSINSLENRIKKFLEYLEELELRVSKNAAKSLVGIQEKLKNLPADATVEKTLSEEIKQACNKLDTTLDSELILRNAFIVTPKRFDIESLLEKPFNLLNEDAKDALPALCKFDFSSACNCIAFSLPTAAAFHLMRSVEGMLRHYYCSIIKRGQIEPLLWHPMIEQLRKRREAPPKSLLDHLDNIRENFRNPTQHPEARYDLDEVQDLLAVSIDALNKMAKDLKTRSAVAKS
jgi:hypothetical protein